MNARAEPLLSTDEQDDTAPLPVNNRQLNVLVVDDLPEAADSTGALLGIHGFRSRVIYDGASALRSATDSSPDVVLLDLAMKGMDGWDLARQLRDVDARKRPLLVAVSGYGNQEAVERSEQAGIDLHFVKPVDPEVLIGLLKRFEKVLFAKADGDGPEAVA